MPALLFHAGRLRLLSIAGLFCLLTVLPASAASRHAALTAHTPFDKAQRMREALEGRPEHQRTRGEYDRVMDAYRAIYHSNPASPYADASISAVADLLAEEGRVFQDEKALHDAIGQYAFLRDNYPQSRYRTSALLTTGEIYLRDLDDPANAKAVFRQFLKLYPQSPLASEARIELRNLRNTPQTKSRNTSEVAGEEGSAVEIEGAKPAKHSSTHSSVPDAATGSRQRASATADRPAPAEFAGDQPAHKAGESNPAAAKPASSSSAQKSLFSDALDSNDADLNAPPPPREGSLPLVTGIRHWSTPVYTRVAIDLQEEVRYEAVRVPNPDRIFFDLHGTRLAPELIGKSDQVIDDGFLKQIRTAQFSNDITRVVLDVSDVSDYSAFFLPNPPRLIIDVHGSKSHKEPPAIAEKSAPSPKPEPKHSEPLRSGKANAIAIADIGLGPDTVPAGRLGAPLGHSPQREAENPATMNDVASLGRQPDRVRATRHPTTAPVAQSVAGTSPAPQPDELAEAAPTAVVAPPIKPTSTKARTQKLNSGPAVIRAAPPVADGGLTMVRALGLKINRIVIDAGHGGHDSGTLGPGGIEEKDVVLDVALRLGSLLKQKLGADVIYTRDDDTFIPLETRTAIANKAQADLFISIHANSSSDPSARGIEVYYLNFTTSADALEVAARENAVSDQSIHQLSDLVKKIALQDKINESREFAEDVDQSLYNGLEDGNPGLKDRGVKKAPFVVLIGANMPSILAEISFLTNPDSAVELRQPQYRERIAESLYRGVARYIGSLNGVRLADASR
jgi:N-acetylmuramoyl-L-alanine amidase